MNTTIFTCGNQFEDMMTCIYDAWASRLGHAHVRLQTEPLGTRELFCDYRRVEPSAEKTASVVRTIRKKISDRAYSMVYHAAMSEAPDKLDVIYRFLILGFSFGPRVLNRLQEPAVFRIFELDRKISNEAHYFKEFVRFFSVCHQQVLVSHIRPKSNILTLIAPHFADRLPSENWIIADDIRRTAVVHPADQTYYVTRLSPEEMQRLSVQENDIFTVLWKEFFHTTGIRERKNKRCQRTMLPLWYRENMTEFN